MDTLITWRAREHQHIEREGDWYWALGIISVSCALTSILFGNFLFALLVVVAAVTFGIVASRPPVVVSCALSEKGLVVDDNFYPYEEMHAFWIEEGDPPLLLIDTPRFMTPDLVVPLEGVDSNVVHAIFLEYVLEKPLRESPLYIIFETIGL